MPALQVRNFPEEMYVLLKENAKNNGRSVSKQTEAILIEYLQCCGKSNAGQAEQSHKDVAAHSAARTSAYETEQACNERLARRKRVMASIAASNYPTLQGVNTVAIIREMREER